MGRLQMLKPAVRLLGEVAEQRRPWQHDRASRQDRGYGAAWERARKRVMQRDHGLCQPCKRGGQLTSASDVDHRVPKFEGGTDDEGNLEAICRSCHLVKTAEETKRSRGAG